MSEPEKRVRPRPGYLMIELNPEERAKLERLALKRFHKTGIRYKLAPTVRAMILEAKE